MSGVARAFTTKRSKRPEISAPAPQRSASTRAGFNIRDKISAPVELVSTTNMLSYNAPNLYPSSSPSSENESDGSRSHQTSPPTSPDSSSISSIPGSPDQSHKSPYFNQGADQFQQYQGHQPYYGQREEPPAIPQRSLSHTKSNHEMVHRHRSQRQSSSKNSISIPENSEASMNLRNKISSSQLNSGISASANASNYLPMHSSRRPSITSPQLQSQSAVSPQMHSSRQNSMGSSHASSISSRQNSMSSSQSTNLSSYGGSVSSGSRQNSMSGSRKNSFSSNRPGSSKGNSSATQQNTSSNNVAISRTTMMMFSPTQQATVPPMPSLPPLPALPSAAHPTAPTLPKALPKQREQARPQPPVLPNSPPPSRSLPETPHPFGKELAQVSELAETYGTKLGVVDEEERDLISRGYKKFTAQDYINEIQGLFSHAFLDARPPPMPAPQQMAWI